MLETFLTTDAPTTVPIPDGFDANCNIINSSGVDLMVLDGFASSDTATEILYEQNLKILAASDASTIIKNGTTATFVLDGSYFDSDSKEWLYRYGYNLIIVRADNLFPIQIAAVEPNDDYSGYDDIPVTAADVTAMQDSQKFQQSLQAYPDSVLATQFSTACGDSLNNSDTSTDIDSKVNAFFASTDNYKDVTLNSLTAIQTYWEAFPFIWAGYAASKSYYLYSSDGTTVSYVGSVNITAPTTAPASIDKSLPGFTLSFTPADNSGTKTLKYLNGQFVDSLETTTVALKGVYQLKSQFTNVSTDNVIMAFLSGSVNNSKVIGYNEKLSKDSNGNWSGFYTLLHPKDAAGWMTLILEVGAVAMTLELFSRPLKFLLDKFNDWRAKNKGADPSKTDADNMRTEAKAKQTADTTEAQHTMDRMGTDIRIKIDININNSVTELQGDRSNRYTEDARSNYIDVTNRQTDSVRTLSKYGMDNNLESMSTKIGVNKAALDPTKTTTEQFAEKLPTVKANSSSLDISIPVEATAKQAKTTAVEKQAITDATEANTEAEKQREEMDNNKDTSDKGDDGDVEMDDMPKGD